MKAPPSITCPRCQATSYNPNDIREAYCARCHDWTTPPKPTEPEPHVEPIDGVPFVIAHKVDGKLVRHDDPPSAWYFTAEEVGVGQFRLRELPRPDEPITIQT